MTSGKPVAWRATLSFFSYSMDLKSFIFGKAPEQKEMANSPPQHAGAIVANSEDGLMKAFAPDYLYNPPYGRPRKDDVILMRNLCKNAYVASVVWTLAEEVSNTEFEISYKKQFVNMGRPTVDKEKEKQEILEWFYNPNGNEESFNLILKKVVTDLLELESGVMIKIFDGKGKFKQVMALDGATILKNPDQYGYYGHRDELVPWFTFQWDEEMGQYVKVPVFKDAADLDRYAIKDRAAYFQYGNYIGFPVPFGRREIVFISRNARTDVTYARPPVAILGDVLYTLVYGSAYNNAFYVNNNVPEGVVSLINGNRDQIEAFKQQFYNEYRVKDGFGNKVKQFFKVPFTNAEVKFTPFMLDPAVMQVLEQQQWFIRLVWACFGVSPDEMGFTDATSGKNVSNQQSAIHKRKSIEPLLRLLEYHINTQIMPEFGVNELEFKFREYDLDEETKKYQLYEIMLRTNMMTVNELRAKEGLEPIEGGDETGMQRADRQMKEQASLLSNNPDSKPGDGPQKNDDQQLSADKNEPETPKEDNKDANEKKPAETKSGVAEQEEDLQDPLLTQYRQAEKKIIKIINGLDQHQLEKVG